MGTRSTIKFYSEYDNNNPVASIYNQFDGYINGGIGHNLAKWLRDKKIINGIMSGQTMQSGYANGMECLAAQYIAEHKERIGGLYMTASDDEQEYNYKVRVLHGNIHIDVEWYGNTFAGTPQELLDYEETED